MRAGRGRGAPGPIPSATADGAALAPREPSIEELGRRIRVLRVTRGLTLKELEQRGGISATHISDVERGRASPTVGALARIAHALGLSPAALVEPTVLPECAVRRHTEPAERCVRIGPAEFRPLGGCVRDGSLGAQLMSIPIAGEATLVHAHAGEEWALVLEGAVEARVGAESWLLREGDSIHFRAHLPHSFANRTSAPALVLVADRPGASLQDCV